MDEEEEEDGMVTGVSEGDGGEGDATGVVEYLLYQLYMALPAEFVECVGFDTER